MAKGFFSWFRKDKSPDEVVAKPQVVTPTQDPQAEQSEILQQAEAAQRLADEQARVEAERIAQQQAQEARLAAEQLAIQEQLAAQEQELAAQKLAAQELAAQEQKAAQALAAKHIAEQLAAEQAQMAAKLLADEQARIEAERIAQQQAQEAQRAAELLAAQELAAQELAAQELAAQEQAAQALAAQEAVAQQLAEQRAREQAEVAQQAKAAQMAADAQAELAASAEQADPVSLERQPEPQARPVKEGLFARLKRGLMRTSENIGSGFIGLFRGKKIDDDLFEELEEQLLIADVGVETTTKLINKLTEHASRKQLKDAEALYELLRDEMQKTLDPVAIPLVPENATGPFVILMVGVNGVGKTTTIGKLAKQYQRQGKSVMLAAGDTFRAAAVEQLQVWGQRNDITVVAQHTGADSASVLFDALQAAKARKIDVLIADTAGRLQNKSHLMEELKKVVRVMKKLDPATPHEVMLTLDASTGQNAISQAQLFQEAVGVTGITISKLDGTAKGGVVFAIADKFNIPIRYIGVGEQIDDLRAFNAKEFIDALFTQEKADS
ncbi:MAG: signal recognition particle-docking protein FtsY [Shewanella sp.]